MRDDDETRARIRAADQRASEAAARTAAAHEQAADAHEQHAAIAASIGESLQDVHRAREQAQRLRATARLDREIARRSQPPPD